MHIETIDAEALQDNLLITIRALSRNDVLLIKNHGKLTGKAIVDDDVLEDLLLLTDDGYLEEISNARKQIAGGNTLTFGEVFGQN